MRSKNYRATDLDSQIVAHSAQTFHGVGDSRKSSCSRQNKGGRDPLESESRDGRDVSPAKKRVKRVSLVQAELAQELRGDAAGTGLVWVSIVGEIARAKGCDRLFGGRATGMNEVREVSASG